MEIIKNYINGNMLAASGGDFLDVEEPASGKIYARIPISTSQEVDQAVDAALDAFEGWSKLPPSDRSDWLHKLANGIEKNHPGTVVGRIKRYG